MTINSLKAVGAKEYSQDEGLGIAVGRKYVYVRTKGQIDVLAKRTMSLIKSINYSFKDNTYNCEGLVCLDEKLYFLDGRTLCFICIDSNGFPNISSVTVVKQLDHSYDRYQLGIDFRTYRICYAQKGATDVPIYSIDGSGVESCLGNYPSFVSSCPYKYGFFIDLNGLYWGSQSDNFGLHFSKLGSNSDSEVSLNKNEYTMNQTDGWAIDPYDPNYLYSCDDDNSSVCWEIVSGSADIPFLNCKSSNVTLNPSSKVQTGKVLTAKFNPANLPSGAKSDDGKIYYKVTLERE